MDEDLMKNLKNLPSQIKERETANHSISKRLNDLKLARNAVELRHTGQVSRETNEENKPIYSNATLREEEVKKRLKVDKDYQDIMGKEVDETVKYNEGVVELNYLKNLFSAIKYRVRLLEVFKEE